MQEQLIGVNPKRILQARVRLAMSLKEVCEKTKFSQEHLAKLETGVISPTYQELEALSKVYDRNLLYFFFQSEPTKYQQLIDGPDYAFLRTNPNLGENIALLTLGGSRAYGMETEESDVDLRGIAVSTKQDILTFRDFEQVEDRDTDTVIYSANKAIDLMASCNPSLIEMLGVKPEHNLSVSPAGQLLIDNKNLFVTKRAKDAFCGYANQQLTRLKASLARNMTPEEQVLHAFNVCCHAVEKLNERYTALGKRPFSVALVDFEVFCNVNLNHVPMAQASTALRDFESVIRNFKAIKKDLLGHRNRKKDDYHTNKHASHLLRLLYTGKHILKEGKIVTASGELFPQILDVRQGAYMKDDGSFDSAFFVVIDELFEEVRQAAKTSKLPERVDDAKIQKLKAEIHSFAR